MRLSQGKDPTVTAAGGLFLPWRKALGEPELQLRCEVRADIGSAIGGGGGCGGAYEPNRDCPEVRNRRIRNGPKRHVP